jgi:hypothetical protein
MHVRNSIHPDVMLGAVLEKVLGMYEVYHLSYGELSEHVNRPVNKLRLSRPQKVFENIITQQPKSRMKYVTKYYRSSNSGYPEPFAVCFVELLLLLMFGDILML